MSWTFVIFFLAVAALLQLGEAQDEGKGDRAPTKPPKDQNERDIPTTPSKDQSSNKNNENARKNSTEKDKGPVSPTALPRDKNNNRTNENPTNNTNKWIEGQSDNKSCNIDIGRVIYQIMQIINMSNATGKISQMNLHEINMTLQSVIPEIRNETSKEKLQMLNEYLLKNKESLVNGKIRAAMGIMKMMEITNILHDEQMKMPAIPPLNCNISKNMAFEMKNLTELLWMYHNIGMVPQGKLCNVENWLMQARLKFSNTSMQREFEENFQHFKNNMNNLRCGRKMSNETRKIFRNIADLLQKVPMNRCNGTVTHQLQPTDIASKVRNFTKMGIVPDNYICILANWLNQASRMMRYHENKTRFDNLAKTFLNNQTYFGSHMKMDKKIMMIFEEIASILDTLCPSFPLGNLTLVDVASYVNESMQNGMIKEDEICKIQNYLDKVSYKFQNDDYGKSLAYYKNNKEMLKGSKPMSDEMKNMINMMIHTLIKEDFKKPCKPMTIQNTLIARILTLLNEAIQNKMITQSKICLYVHYFENAASEISDRKEKINYNKNLEYFKDNKYKLFGDKTMDEMMTEKLQQMYDILFKEENTFTPEESLKELAILIGKINNEKENNEITKEKILEYIKTFQNNLAKYLNIEAPTQQPDEQQQQQQGVRQRRSVTKDSVYNEIKEELVKLSASLVKSEEQLSVSINAFLKLVMKLESFLEGKADETIDEYPLNPILLDASSLCSKRLNVKKESKVKYLTIMKKFFGTGEMMLMQEKVIGKYSTIKENEQVFGKLKLQSPNQCGCARLKIGCVLNKENQVEFITYICQLQILGEKQTFHNNEIFQPSIKLNESCFSGLITSESLTLDQYQIKLTDKVSFGDATPDSDGYADLVHGKKLELTFYEQNCPLQLPIVLNRVTVGSLVYFPKNKSIMLPTCQLINKLPSNECYKEFTSTWFMISKLFTRCASIDLLKNRNIKLKSIASIDITVMKMEVEEKIQSGSSSMISYDDKIKFEPMDSKNKMELILEENGNILMNISIKFESQVCGDNGEFTGCELLALQQQCRFFRKNQTLFDKCVDCRRNYKDGTIDECGVCFKNVSEKSEKSKCVCIGSNCNECPVSKFLNKCVSCLGSKILDCDGTTCVEKTQKGDCITAIQKGCLMNTNRMGQCKLSSSSDSSTCPMSLISKDDLLKRPRSCVSLQYGYGVSNECKSGQYDIICEINNKEEKLSSFSFNKQKPVTLDVDLQGLALYDYGKLKLVCKNNDGCGELIGEAVIGNQRKLIQFSSNENMRYESISQFKFIPNIEVTISDCCGGKHKLTPSLKCEAPVPEKPIVKSYGYLIKFNKEVFLVDKPACQNAKRIGNSVAFKSLDRSMIGECVRSKCQSADDNNDFSSLEIPNLVKREITCKHIQLGLKFRANFSCEQSNGWSSTAQGFTYLIAISNLNISQPITCRVTSSDVVFDKTFTVDLKDQKLGDKCLEIKMTCDGSGENCKLFVPGKKEIKWVVQELGITTNTEKLPFYSMRSFEMDKVLEVKVQLQSDPTIYAVKNFTIPKFKFKIKSIKDNIVIDCSKKVPAKKLYTITKERKLKVINQRHIFVVGEERFEVENFNDAASCDSVIQLHVILTVQHRDAKVSKDINKVIEIQYTTKKCPKVLINSQLFPNNQCKKRMKMTLSNIKNANDVSTSLENDGNRIDITGAVTDIKNNPFDKLFCFNDLILDMPSTYQFNAIVASSSGENSCREISESVDIVVEDELKAEISCPASGIQELGELVLNIISDSEIQTTCTQVNIEQGSDRVSIFNVVKDRKITCVIRSSDGRKEITVVVPNKCLEGIESVLAKMNEAQLAEHIANKIDLTERIKCKNVIRSYKISSSKDFQQRRRRRAIGDSSQTCDADTVKTCFDNLNDAYTLVVNRVEDEMPNLIKPPICEKRCLQQSPCSIAFDVVNTYFHQKKDSDELFTNDESDFFHCGFSSIIYPVENNVGMGNAIGNFTTFIVDIQKTLVVSSIGLDQPKNIEADFIGTKTWLYEGSSGPSTFNWNESALVLNEMFQSTYNNWECSGVINCTTVFVSMTKMKLHYDASTESFKDPLTIGAVSQTGIYPITDIYIVNFFSPVNEYDVINIDDPSKYYVINMTAHRKDSNATIRCYHFENDAFAWKPSSFNAQLNGDTISCVCSKPGPCAGFEVSDIAVLIPTESPVKTTTEQMREMSTSTPMSNTSTDILQTTATTEISQTVEISFDVDYDTTCSRYNSRNECSVDICGKTRKKIDVPAENFMNCGIMEGSIIVQFVVTGSSQGNLNATLDSIKSLVKNETFVITLADGTTLTADENSYKEGSDVTSTEQPPNDEEDDDDDHKVIIIVVSIVLGLGLVIVFAVVYIMCKKGKQKVVPSPHASATSMRHLSPEI